MTKQTTSSPPVSPNTLAPPGLIQELFNLLDGGLKGQGRIPLVPGFLGSIPSLGLSRASIAVDQFLPWISRFPGEDSDWQRAGESRTKYRLNNGSEKPMCNWFLTRSDKNGKINIGPITDVFCGWGRSGAVFFFLFLTKVIP